MPGRIIPLNAVGDRGFASGQIGDGLAIAPEGGVVTAPVAGTVTTLFSAKQALTVMDEDGVEVLLHLGIGTVALKGQYFESHVSRGDFVKIGDPLITMDLAGLEAEGFDPTVLVVLPDLEEPFFLEKTEQQHLEQGDRLMLVCE